MYIDFNKLDEIIIFAQNKFLARELVLAMERNLAEFW